MSKKTPAPNLTTPIARGLVELFEKLNQIVQPNRNVNVYLAGGVAAHLYVPIRPTDDVDAEFSARIAIPDNLVVQVFPDNENQQASGAINLHFDKNFNTTFDLLHEDYTDRAVPLNLPESCAPFQVFALAPVDLAITKIARLSDHDLLDIEAMARANMIDSDELSHLANEALDVFIGNKGFVIQNILTVTSRVLEIQLEEGFRIPASSNNP